jgi:hypothetical protein
VESHSHRGMDPDVADCSSIERTAGLRHARQSYRALRDLAASRLHFLFLIADIDSSRGGVIRIQPQNLYALAESLKAQ